MGGGERDQKMQSHLRGLFRLRTLLGSNLLSGGRLIRILARSLTLKNLLSGKEGIMGRIGRLKGCSCFYSLQQEYQ